MAGAESAQQSTLGASEQTVSSLSVARSPSAPSLSDPASPTRLETAASLPAGLSLGPSGARAAMAPTPLPIPAWVGAWRPPAGAYGQCPAGGTRLQIVLDESGSISDADPIAYRHALLARVLDSLSTSCQCGECTVEIVLFGAGATRASEPLGSHPWRGCGQSLGSKVTRVPATGSYLAPALEQLGAPSDSCSGVTICLTDLQLFDPDPSGEVERLTARPRPLLLLLGVPEPPANLPCPWRSSRPTPNRRG